MLTLARVERRMTALTRAARETGTASSAMAA